jgi:hypothetical protein
MLSILRKLCSPPDTRFIICWLLASVWLFETASSAQTNFAFKLLGKWIPPTDMSAIFVQANDQYVYVGLDPGGVAILDARNPSNAVMIGQCDTGGSVSSLALINQYVLAADDSTGLQVIDASIPTNPQLVGNYSPLDPDNYIFRLAAMGNYAYVLQWNDGLYVIDVSAPQNPRRVGNIAVSGLPVSIAVAGNYAIVGTYFGGMDIIDISNPTNPRRVGSYKTTGPIMGLALSGQFAFITAQEFEVIDISNPLIPQRIGSNDTGGQIEVVVSGNLVFLSGGGIHVNDLSQQTNPRKVGWFDTDGGDSGTVSIALSSNLVYAACPEVGLLVVQVSSTESTPTSPQVTAQPQSQTVRMGDSVSFSLDVKGIAPFNYQWRKDGFLMPLETNSVLSINNLILNDMGNYTVVVSNVYGSVTSAPAILTVTGDPPQFLGTLRDQSVAQGQSLVLFSPALGWEPIQYQWFFEGRALSGSNLLEVAFSSAQLAHAGSYYSVASNHFGLATSSVAHITILAPLKVTTSKTTNLIEPGSNLTLHAAVEGGGPYQYQWQVNGEAIPTATNATYVITNALPKDGGSYRIVVANPAEVIAADIAEVDVRVPQAPPEDDFVNRHVLTGPSGFITSSNTLATFENGEPEHAGKHGGHSIWYRWTAAARGNLSLSTAGSAFDTLLAVYQGTQVDQLNIMASDEDSGGYLTSMLMLPVQAGQEYAIAIDGFAGATGRVVLEWQLEVTAEEMPQIVAHPTNTVVGLGQSNQLEVIARGTNLKYQWYQNEIALAGGNQSQLVLINVQTNQAGSYRVAVINEHGTRTNWSQRASLEVYQVLEGTPPEVTPGQDKSEDLGLETGGTTPQQLRWATPQSFSPVSGYTITTWSANLYDTTQNNENVNGQAVGYNTRSFGLDGPKVGTWLCTLSTEGSGFDTILEVRNRKDKWDEVQVAYNDDSAPGVKTSRLQFIARPGITYKVVVSGKNGGKGKFQLTRWFEPQQKYWLSKNQHDQGLLFGLQVPRGWAFQVDQSHDLRTWGPYYSTTSSSGKYELRVRADSVDGRCFYRALLILPVEIAGGQIRGAKEGH